MTLQVRFERLAGGVFASGDDRIATTTIDLQPIERKLTAEPQHDELSIAISASQPMGYCFWLDDVRIYAE